MPEKCTCPHGCANLSDLHPMDLICSLCLGADGACPIMRAAFPKCQWCKSDAVERAQHHEGPHATWCIHFREQRGGHTTTLPWKFAKTYRDAPHEYILTHQNPELFKWFLQKIKTEARAEQFTLRGRTATYRYYHAGDGYKYWIIQNVLNRAKVIPDPNPQAELNL